MLDVIHFDLNKICCLKYIENKFVYFISLQTIFQTYDLESHLKSR